MLNGNINNSKYFIIPSNIHFLFISPLIEKTLETTELNDLVRDNSFGIIDGKTMTPEEEELIRKFRSNSDVYERSPGIFLDSSELSPDEVNFIRKALSR